MNSRSLRVLVALVGTFAMAGLLVVDSGFADRTLAGWNDRVAGAAAIDVPEAYGKGYARAVAARYSMSRPTGSSVRNGLDASRKPGQTPNYADVNFGDQNSVGGNLGLLLPVRIDGASCAVYASPVAVPCTNGRNAGPSVVFAAAAARGLLVKTTTNGIDLARFGPADVVSTTASCPVGGSPSPGGITSFFGGVVLAGMGNTEKLPFPSDPGPNGARSTRQDRSGFGYDYEAQLTWTKTRSATSASSEIRLHMTSTGKISGTEKWELDMVLAYAECGIGADAPIGRPEVKPTSSGLPAPMAKQGAPSCPSDESLAADAEPIVCEGDERTAPPIDLPAEPDTGTTSPRPAPDGGGDTNGTTDSEASIPESEPDDGDPTAVEEPAPTSSSPVPAGPTRPTRVGVATPFSLVATDGNDLGTATVEEVTRTPGCVAVRLTVSTSPGAHHLEGLRVSDFEEVLVDGGTAAVGSATGECDGGTPLPTVFDPATTYSGWVTFDVTNSGTGVSLRPDGTAGWIFALPAVVTLPEPEIGAEGMLAGQK